MTYNFLETFIHLGKFAVRPMVSNSEKLGVILTPADHCNGLPLFHINPPQHPIFPQFMTQTPDRLTPLSVSIKNARTATPKFNTTEHRLMVMTGGTYGFSTVVVGAKKIRNLKKWENTTFIGEATAFHLRSDVRCFLSEMVGNGSLSAKYMHDLENFLTEKPQFAEKIMFDISLASTSYCTDAGSLSVLNETHSMNFNLILEADAPVSNIRKSA